MDSPFDWTQFRADVSDLESTLSRVRYILDDLELSRLTRDARADLLRRWRELREELRCFQSVATSSNPSFTRSVERCPGFLVRLAEVRRTATALLAELPSPHGTPAPRPSLPPASVFAELDRLISAITQANRADPDVQRRKERRREIVQLQQFRRSWKDSLKQRLCWGWGEAKALARVERARRLYHELEELGLVEPTPPPSIARAIIQQLEEIEAEHAATQTIATAVRSYCVQERILAPRPDDPELPDEPAPDLALELLSFSEAGIRGFLSTPIWALCGAAETVATDPDAELNFRTWLAGWLEQPAVMTLDWIDLGERLYDGVMEHLETGGRRDLCELQSALVESLLTLPRVSA